MIIVFVGLMFLLATLFPLGGEIARLISGGMYGPVFKAFPPIIFHLIVLALTYLPAGLIVSIFLRKSALKERLPPDVPGKAALVIGVLIIGCYIVIRLFASTIQGGGPSFVVAQLGAYPLLFAKVLLLIGAVQVLLSAGPRPKDAQQAVPADVARPASRVVRRG